MTLLKRRLAATEKKLAEIKEAQRIARKQRRAVYKQTRVDIQRKMSLVGEAVLRRVESGEWDEAEFRKMMDEVLTRPVDRALFDLD